MRKSIVFGLFLLAILALNACKQDSKAEDFTNPSTTNLYDVSTGLFNATGHLATDKDETEAKLVAMRQNLESFRRNPNAIQFRSSEFTPLETAIVNLEALMNYEYAEAQKNPEILQLDSTKFIIETTTSGSLTQGKILEATDKTVDALRAHFQAFQANDKYVLAVDIKGEPLTETTAEITVVSALGKWVLDCDINMNDYRWGFLLGKCDGTLANVTDAAKEIERVLNRRLSSGGRVYFTDVLELNTPFWHDRFEITVNDPRYDWYYCMNWTERDYHTHNMESLLRLVIPSRGSQYSFVKASVSGEAVVGHSILHISYYSTGIMHGTGTSAATF